MGRLTEADLQAWVRDGVGLAGRTDGNGLTFTLSAKGTAAWTLRYYIGAKQRELTLGRYPGISLDHARDLAAQARSMIALGLDVAAAKQSEKRRQRQGTRNETRNARVQCAPVANIADAVSLLSKLEGRRVRRVLVTVEFQEEEHE
jgi:hypothetical protein